MAGASASSSTSLAQFPGRVALACSFQKEESVLLDMLSSSSRTRASSRSTRTTSSPRRTSSGARSSAATTRRSRCFEAAPEPVEDGLWETNPDLYLAIARSSRSTARCSTSTAWITGIRRDQSPTRADAPKLGWDDQHELWKANPLADWTDDDCWAYIRERELPYNALHDQGYDSIGDTHSTHARQGPRRPLGRHGARPNAGCTRAA